GPPADDKGQTTVSQQETSSSPAGHGQPDGEADVDMPQAPHSVVVETKAAPSTPTLSRKAHSAPSVHPTPSQPERMTTRVSSGAIRHKSVSEILGEVPKSAHADRPTDLI